MGKEVNKVMANKFVSLITRQSKLITAVSLLVLPILTICGTSYRNVSFGNYGINRYVNSDRDDQRVNFNRDRDDQHMNFNRDQDNRRVNFNFNRDRDDHRGNRV
jgi:hypothetical protein